MYVKSHIVKRIAQLILAVSMVTGATIAHADDDDKPGPFFGKEAAGKWIIGGKVGKIDPNIQGWRNADVHGVVAGYEFAKEIGEGTSSFELEYLKGDKTRISGTILDYRVDILNAFFTYRSPGMIFYKFKGGLSYSDYEYRLGFLEIESSEVGLAAGLGLGYRFGELGEVELEYSLDTSDNDLGILGLNVLFEF